ncbi:MAG: hypothetical protein ACE5JH_00435 [Acidobacteriota bacterium]
MNRDHTKAGTGPRQAYEPPQLRRVRLVPDEAVLASCKNNVTNGPTGIAGKCIGQPSQCFMNES